MVTILKENTRGSRLGEQFANAITSGAEEGRKFAHEMGLQNIKSQQSSGQLLAKESSKKRQMEYGEQLKRDTKVKEEQEVKENLYKTFTPILDKMDGLVSYVGATGIPGTKSFWGDSGFTESSEKRAEIDTLRLSLEGLFRDLTLKGQFPAAIYERVLENLPDSNDSERRYKGKINAIRGILKSHFHASTEKSSEGEKELDLNQFYNSK
jgi:hypothetical protein